VLRALFVLAAAAAIAGCAQLRPMPEGAPQAGGFDLSGRVAIRYGSDSATGGVQWRHSTASDDLLITNPLGQGVARITRDANEVHLETADGRKESAPDAETLTERVLGWRLPLEGLPVWVRAKARPDRPAEVLRDDGQRVRELRQDDWKVEYLDYEGSRPSRMKLSRRGLEILLVIQSWQAEGP
jgi:outer membrane lipoprotein LolB